MRIHFSQETLFYLGTQINNGGIRTNWRWIVRNFLENLSTDKYFVVHRRHFRFWSRVPSLSKSKIASLWLIDNCYKLDTWNNSLHSPSLVSKAPTWTEKDVAVLSWVFIICILKCDYLKVSNTKMSGLKALFTYWFRKGTIMFIWCDLWFHN